ncbi:family 43 glycosylhydrolase [uncultured Cohaesibacter sp.]|uniref:family 43 glycosylhydrolase n=1 Tax=uncultured Cohaesibacter sp. TaxID=1002546 RepID=UPI0029C7EF5B|nr:family 43 glycosylhydrolase [uncultured Cohaesibacter sp.]
MQKLVLSFLLLSLCAWPRAFSQELISQEYSSPKPQEISLHMMQDPTRSSSQSTISIIDSNRQQIIGIGIRAIEGKARLIMRQPGSGWIPVELETDELQPSRNIWPNSDFSSLFIKFYIARGRKILVFINGMRIAKSARLFTDETFYFLSQSAESGHTSKPSQKSLPKGIFSKLAGSFAKSQTIPDLADPNISYFDGVYYLTGTTGGRKNTALACFISSDLKSWQENNACSINNDNEPFADFAKWAPSLIQRKEGIYALYAQVYRQEPNIYKKRDFGLRGIGFKFIPRDRSGNLLKEQTTTQMLVGSDQSYYKQVLDPTRREIQIIDPEIFEMNDNGHVRSFLLWKERPLTGIEGTGRDEPSDYRYTTIAVQEIEVKAGTISLIGNGPQKLIQSYLGQPHTTWARNDEQGTWQGPLIENPSLLLHDNIYYLFYSAHRFYQADYSTGLAIASALDERGRILPPTDPRLRFVPLFNSPLFASTMSNDLIGGTAGILGGNGLARYVGAGGLSIFPIADSEGKNGTPDYGAAFHAYKIEPDTNMRKLNKSIKRSTLIGRLYFDATRIPNIIP